jgi:hypothetical protein
VADEQQQEQEQEKKHEEQNRNTYFAHRDETVAPFPFGQTTVNGLSVIPPPHENPAHPSEMGETICRSVSNGVLVVALSGTAMRKTGMEGPHEYSR